MKFKIILLILIFLCASSFQFTLQASENLENSEKLLSKTKRKSITLVPMCPEKRTSSAYKPKVYRNMSNPVQESYEALIRVQLLNYLIQEVQGLPHGTHESGDWEKVLMPYDLTFQASRYRMPISKDLESTFDPLEHTEIQILNKKVKKRFFWISPLPLTNAVESLIPWVLKVLNHYNKIVLVAATILKALNEDSNFEVDRVKAELAKIPDKETRFFFFLELLFNKAQEHNLQGKKIKCAHDVTYDNSLKFYTYVSVVVNKPKNISIKFKANGDLNTVRKTMNYVMKTFFKD